MVEDGRKRYLVEIDAKDIPAFERDMINFPGSKVVEMTPEQESVLFPQNPVEPLRNKEDVEKDLWSAEVADLENRILDLRFSLDIGDEGVRKRFEQLYKSVRREIINRDRYAGRQETRTLDSFIAETLTSFEKSAEFYTKYEKKSGIMRSKKRRRVFEYRRESGILTPREIRMLCIKLQLKEDESLVEKLIESEGDIGVIEAGKQAQRNLGRFLSPLPTVINVDQVSENL